MRKMLIILVSTVVTALNINAYGDLDYTKLEKAKLIGQTQKEIVIKKSINWGFGSTLFKLIHFAEIMFISEIGRRRLN
jgi:hypothetical protein